MFKSSEEFEVWQESSDDIGHISQIQPVVLGAGITIEGDSVNGDGLMLSSVGVFVVYYGADLVKVYGAVPMTRVRIEYVFK